MLMNQGLIDAYDVKTGQEIYRQRIPHQGSGFSSSPVAADGRIYLSSEDGVTSVVRAGPRFELLAENSLDDYVLSSPAVSDGQLFLRTAEHLWAIGQRRLSPLAGGL